jgi:hypothetical protein
MGGVVLFSSCLVMFVNISGHAGICCGKDSPENKASALAVPELDEEIKAEVNKDETDGTEGDDHSEHEA